MKKEVTVRTVIQDAQRSHDEPYSRWHRTQRAHLFDQYLALQAQGLSLRQAAKALEVPRSTLQAWRAYQESLDEHPAVVAFFHSAPGLAFLHRLVVAIHLVCTEVGACGIRLVCLLINLSGLDRFVAASYGTQPQVNRQVEAAIVTYRQEESARLAQDMPAKDITLARHWFQNKKAGWYTVLAAPQMPAMSTVLDQAHNAIDRKLFAMKGFHHPSGSQAAFLTGLAHLYNLIPYQRRAKNTGLCGVQVEGGRVPTSNWMLNLQILTSGGYRYAPDPPNH